jgi:hypothetical protein
VKPRSPLNPKRLLVILVISLLVFLLIERFGWLRPEPLPPTPDDPARAVQIQWLLRVIFLPLLPIGVYVAYLGYRIIRSGRFPPPNSRLLKRLPPQNGTLAEVRGWLALFTGLCLCGLGIYGAVIVPHEIARLLNIQ